MLIFSVIAGVFCEPRLGRFHYLDSLSCQFMLYLQVKELKMIASVLSLEGDCFFCQDVQAVCRFAVGVLFSLWVFSEGRDFVFERSIRDRLGYLNLRQTGRVTKFDVMTSSTN